MGGGTNVIFGFSSAGIIYQRLCGAGIAGVFVFPVETDRRAGEAGGKKPTGLDNGDARFTYIRRNWDLFEPSAADANAKGSAASEDMSPTQLAQYTAMWLSRFINAEDAFYQNAEGLLNETSASLRPDCGQVGK